MNIVQASLKYKQVTLSVLAVIFILGVYSMFNMPRREDPKITIREGLVLAFYPGANSMQVEEQVTKKLEQYLFQYNEVKKAKTHSTTTNGAVVIYVELQDWVKDPDVFWSKLNHELNYAKAVDLPQGVQGPIVNTDFGDTIAMLIGIESDSLDYSQLKPYVGLIEDRLRRIRSVSKIKRIGEQTEQITISTSSEKMAQYGIRLSQVMQLLRSQNAIQATGDLQLRQFDVPLYTRGYYNTLDQIDQQIVGTSTTGNIVRFGDMADIRRDFADPTQVVTHNQHQALMLSLELQEGNNVVKFGEAVNQALAELSAQLPATIRISTIVDQPKLVRSSVNDFIREFFLAIVSVIVVTLLLLPFRVASVAAMAIPVTIAVTFGLLNIFGIELQQVSLAALIVVLGMVVDDAIVIADNYIELLDEGMDRWTAAWRSASDLMVPVLTATATIVCSFLPLIILSGSVGEFIFSLPITVTIALTSSFLVAMLLTPMLCYTFIRKGLKDHSPPASGQPAKKRLRSLLDLLQDGYDVAIGWCMRHKILTISGSILSVVAGLALFSHLRQRFFPSAERNQFVIEYWMPTGSRLEKTRETLQKMEGLVKNDPRVADFATFAGTGAPRFYYNFSPEPPVTNYGMILINTHTNDQAEEMAAELTKKVDTVAPAGMAYVKLMQQGEEQDAPIEVRIIGDDIAVLKGLGARVQQILKKTPGSLLVRSDFHEDYYGVSIDLKGNANRLGFTTASIADNINTGFAGTPVSVMWEGNQPIDLVLRLDEKKRENFTDIRNDYLSSPVTGANVPLRQVADLVPEWQTGRVMHRNGVRTLTVQSETQPGALPSEVLQRIQPEIAGIHLPKGYRIEDGGEDENQKETFGQMIIALSISLGLIFFILLFQFKGIKEALLIMTSIPLCLFGAILGLVVTKNPFGFTSFIGLISLSGIVVRNSIILVDHTNLLIRQGMDLRTAAIESGKRRLRPIFLTASAAAIGVLPMILSGSSMWSPLASVLAFGVVFSMVMTLLVTPLLFVILVKSKAKAIPLALVLVLLAPCLHAQQSQVITLEQAKKMALEHNSRLLTQREKIVEDQAKVQEAKSKRYPILMATANYVYNTGTEDIPFLKTPHNLYSFGALAAQPILEQGKINAGVRVADADVKIARTQTLQSAQQVLQSVEQLFYGSLIAQKNEESIRIGIELTKLKLYDEESALLAGQTDSAVKAGLQADLAQQEEQLLEARDHREDDQGDLAISMGLPYSAVFELTGPTDSLPVIEPFDFYLQSEKGNNLDILLAGQTLQKAVSGVSEAKKDYLPSLDVVGGYFNQSIITVLPTINYFIGLQLSWNFIDFGKRRSVLNERKSQQKQAELNLDYSKRSLDNEVFKAYRKAIRSETLLAASKKALDYRRADYKLKKDHLDAGLALPKDLLQTRVALANAEKDYYSAELACRISITALEIIAGISIHPLLPNQ